MSVIILMRGISGSSKSYTANKLKEKLISAGHSVKVCSADSFFINSEGVYEFDGEKVGLAHSECRLKFAKALLEEIDYIVLDNTNLVWSSLKDYVLFGGLAKADIYILEKRVTKIYGFLRNQHGVSYHKIKEQFEKFVSRESIIEMAKNLYNIEVKIWNEETN